MWSLDSDYNWKPDLNDETSSGDFSILQLIHWLDIIVNVHSEVFICKDFYIAKGIWSPAIDSHITLMTWLSTLIHPKELLLSLAQATFSPTPKCPSWLCAVVTLNRKCLQTFLTNLGGKTSPDHNPFYQKGKWLCEKWASLPPMTQNTEKCQSEALS